MDYDHQHVLAADNVTCMPMFLLQGYAVPAHYAAIEAHGPCDIHRRSFQPIRGITGWTREAQLAQEAAEAVKAAGGDAEAAAEPVVANGDGVKKAKRGKGKRKSVV